VEFCDRLSRYTKREYRLPSEAEWEYGCRGGTKTPFHFGETITTEVANYDGNYIYGKGVKGEYREETTEVGKFGVGNEYGLYDMHGNICEWCLDDWHDNYEGAPEDGRAWFNNENENLSQKEGDAALRGGSWIDIPRDCRSASRSLNRRGRRGSILSYVGFRVVCGGVGRTL
jgi:formylglycine-generating enzyme required for sulfatase activity